MSCFTVQLQYSIILTNEYMILRARVGYKMTDKQNNSYCFIKNNQVARKIA